MKLNLENKDRFYLFFILLLASVLRFYKAFEIPFTHDEFSALFRTEFTRFSDLIKGGVLTDTHPAGVQVFLFYWIKLFGKSEFIVKLPFILMGIGAVFYTWKLSKTWYNTSVAILCSLLLAGLEFPLMHSQIARPYISGLFLSLWMVYHWTYYLFKRKNNWNKNWIYFVVAATLASYNHHFSLLFAALVGISGLFFIPRKRLPGYLSAGLLIFLLYVPHLPVFFHQLEKGGVGGSDGWLGAPQSDFLWTFIRYLFNYSSILLGMALLLILSSMSNLFKTIKAKWRIQFLFLLWFLIPFFIGYYYSILVNPVIQYSVLIFSFPFLFFFLFGFLPELSHKWRLVLIGVLLPVLLYTTIVKRDYFTLFYNSPFKGVVAESKAFAKEKGGEVFAFIDARKDINEYYLDSLGRDFEFSYVSDFENRGSLVEFISNNEWDAISYGYLSRADQMLPAILVDHYPIIEKKINYNQGNFYAFSKNGNSSLSMYRPQRFFNSYEEELNNWEFNRERTIRVDTLNNDKQFAFKKGQEWGVGFDIPFEELDYKENDLIDVRLEVYPKNKNFELLIVSEIYNEIAKFDWRASSSNDFKINGDSTSFKMYHCIKLSDISFPKKDAKLKIYIWNKGKTKLNVDDFDIRIRIGNPILYALLNEFDDD